MAEVTPAVKPPSAKIEARQTPSEKSQEVVRNAPPIAMRQNATPEAQQKDALADVAGVAVGGVIEADDAFKILEQQTKTELAPITFQIDNNNSQHSKFWEHIYKTALVKPEFAERAKTASLDTLPTLVLQELAGRLQSDHSILENPSRVAKQFVDWITKRDWEVDRAVWENYQMRNAVLDALLIKADGEAAQTGNLVKQKDIMEARQLLRTPGHLSAVYIGTSSAALPGIEQANVQLLSASKLQEKGVVRRTGEGTRGGASASGVLEQGISATTLFETADSYADLNATIYHQTLSKALEEMARIDEQVAKVNEYAADPNLSKEDKEWVRRRLDELADAKLVTQRQYDQLQAEESPKSEDVFPIIFGLDEVPVARYENNGLYSFRTDNEIRLRDKLRNVYVPSEKITEVQRWMSSMDMNKRNVLPLEAMRLVRELDPHLDRDRERVRNNASFIKMRYERGVVG